MSKIHVLSFDFDNCLFNESYKWPRCNPNVNEVIDKNLELLDNINSNKSKYDELIVFIGSNRQSNSMDVGNSKGSYPTESCYKAVIKVCKYLDATFDNFLLSDIYSKKDPGTSYDWAILNPESFCYNWFLDVSKLTILYSQMHKVALKYPNDFIFYDFYDDKGLSTYNLAVLLENLETFFIKNDSLIPKNVLLQLYHYDGGKVTPYKPIQGTGIIDSNYYETVLEMSNISKKKFNDNESTSCASYVELSELTKRIEFVNASSSVEMITNELSPDLSNVTVNTKKSSAVGRKNFKAKSNHHGKIKKRVRKH